MESPNQMVKKHAGGRPTKYNERIIKVTKDYIDEALVSKEIPTIEKLSLLLDVDNETILEWSKKYKEYSALIKKVKSLQRDWLIRRSLARFNPGGAIFLLKALHGYVDTIRTEITGRNGGEITLRIAPMLTKYHEMPAKKDTKELSERNETIGQVEPKSRG